MGRAQPKRAKADYAKLKLRVALGLKIQREFAGLLNLDEPRFSGKLHGAVVAVQIILGAYNLHKRLLDNAPRPANRLAELNELLKASTATYHDLTDLSLEALGDLTWAKLNKELWPEREPSSEDRWNAEAICRAIDQLKRDLAVLVEVLPLAGQKLKGVNSRHGKRKLATNSIVLELECIFDLYYRPNPESNKLDDKILFIQEALDALNEHLKRDEFKHSKSQITRLLATKN